MMRPCDTLGNVLDIEQCVAGGRTGADYEHGFVAEGLRVAVVVGVDVATLRKILKLNF